MESLRRLKWGMGKSDVITYLIQVVDEPYQIIVIDILQAIYIFVPVKRFTEPIVKVG